jgi:hypothetical protein
MKYIDINAMVDDKYYILYHMSEYACSVLLIYTESDMKYPPFNEEDDFTGEVVAMIDGRSYMSCYRYRGRKRIIANTIYNDTYDNGFEFFTDSITETEVFELSSDEILSYLAYMV